MCLSMPEGKCLCLIVLPSVPGNPPGVEKTQVCDRTRADQVVTEGCPTCEH